MTTGSSDYDVAIVGGGPGGSTVASLLRRYNPDLRILVVEKEVFPREHVGESLLPSVCGVLNEMGCWDKVEAANFPIKIGASLTWGKSDEAWDFDFFPPEQLPDLVRPGKYEAERVYTAFQVDRSIYDNILLNHTESVGAEVRQGLRVDEIQHDDGCITGMKLATGETITARHYVDASGNVALLRRALGVESEAPTELRNIAIYDYWENAEWGVEIGTEATRVFIRSLAYGWLWFIPLGPDRTSIGLICPAEYYRESGKAPEELYHEAIKSEKDIAQLTSSAQPDGTVRTVKDWSHVAKQVAGSNWFLCGEAAGFADPILAAGLALTHATAREVAYTILELERGDIDPCWLRNRYNSRTRTSIQQHIRFAQYWYSANGQFTDLHDHCAGIAREAGLRLSPKQAWRWLAQGGFVNHSVASPQFGSFDVFSARVVMERLSGKESAFALTQNNSFKLNLHGAEIEKIGDLQNGRIRQFDCYVKGDRRLPMAGPFENLIRLLTHTDNSVEMLAILERELLRAAPERKDRYLQEHLQALETMIHDNWVLATNDRSKKILRLKEGSILQIRDTAEGMRVLEDQGRLKTPLTDYLADR